MLTYPQGLTRRCQRGLNNSTHKLPTRKIAWISSLLANSDKVGRQSCQPQRHRVATLTFTFQSLHFLSVNSAETSELNWYLLQARSIIEESALFSVCVKNLVFYLLSPSVSIVRNVELRFVSSLALLLRCFFFNGNTNQCLSTFCGRIDCISK